MERYRLAFDELVPSTDGDFVLYADHERTMADLQGQIDTLKLELRNRASDCAEHDDLQAKARAAYYELAALFPHPSAPTLDDAKVITTNKNEADAKCILKAYEALREVITK